MGFGVNQERSHFQSYAGFVFPLKKRMMYAFRLASAKEAESQKKQKKGHDLRSRGAKIEVG